MRELGALSGLEDEPGVRLVGSHGCEFEPGVLGDLEHRVVGERTFVAHEREVQFSVLVLLARRERGLAGGDRGLPQDREFLDDEFDVGVVLHQDRKSVV